MQIQQIQSIHKSPTRIVYVNAGAGTQALHQLLNIGGASRTLLEAIVPYSQSAFDNFLGQTPDQYVADKTARLLAGRAYQRACQLAGPSADLVGISCTASIASDRPKRGEHRAYVAAWQPSRLDVYDLYLEKGVRDRQGEEALISQLVIDVLSDACGINGERLWQSALQDARLIHERCDFQAVTQQLLQGKIDYFGVHDHGRIRTTDVHPQTLLSGSFNPLHIGHLGMAAAASKRLARPIAFELSAQNVDKPPLEAAVVLGRVAQFAGEHPIYVSNAPTYLEKSRLYPGATFVVGYDTAVRIFETRYYQNSEETMLAALSEIQARGCHFLVAGRLCEDGNFRTLEDIMIPIPFDAMFSAIPDEDFRVDISSTELRASEGKQ